MKKQGCMILQFTTWLSSSLIHASTLCLWRWWTETSWGCEKRALFPSFPLPHRDSTYPSSGSVLSFWNIFFQIFFLIYFICIFIIFQNPLCLNDKELCLKAKANVHWKIHKINYYYLQPRLRWYSKCTLHSQGGTQPCHKEDTVLKGEDGQKWIQQTSWWLNHCQNYAYANSLMPVHPNQHPQKCDVLPCLPLVSHKGGF